MKRYFTLVITLLAAISMMRADGLDDQYVQIFNVIQEADSLSNNHPDQALAKYSQAQTALQRLKSGSPDWNSKVVGFRLSYVSAKIAALSAKAPAAVEASSTAKTSAPGAPVPAPRAGAVPTDSEGQLATLKDQIRQLQAERVTLEAKLKEALAVVPAESDPRELARAEEKLKALQKENELLKLGVEKAKGSAAPVAPAKSTEDPQLAQAQAQVAALQLDKERLRLELTALENRVKQLSVTTPAPARVVATPPEDKTRITQLEREREELQKQLALAKTELSKAARTEPRPAAPPQDATHLKHLERERDDLQKQLALAKKELSNSARTAQAAASQNTERIKQLETESQDLQKQLALAKKQSSTPAPIVTSPATGEGERIKQLEQERKDLQLQLALAKEISHPAAPVAAPPAQAGDAGRIKQLERERDDLQRQLAAANKELQGRKGKASNVPADLQNQLAAARARLEVLEARQVPYSAEEQELFKQPATQLAQTPAKSSKKSSKELPPGTAPLVAEAQRYFSARQYDKAEQAYMQVLQHDEKNVLALANLAAIQVEAQHFDAADANVRKALAIDPEDAYSLYVLGILQVRQHKYDEALDALSRAAKLDPQNPEIQNYLGLTLSEKGLRGPAETALRKAVELQPTYGSAHYNLAVFYLSQQPAYPALARWHYQKAIAAGHPSNAEVEKRLDTKQ